MPLIPADSSYHAIVMDLMGKRALSHHVVPKLLQQDGSFAYHTQRLASLLGPTRQPRMDVAALGPNGQFGKLRLSRQGRLWLVEHATYGTLAYFRGHTQALKEALATSGALLCPQSQHEAIDLLEDLTSRIHTLHHPQVQRLLQTDAPRNLVVAEE